MLKRLLQCHTAPSHYDIIAFELQLHRHEHWREPCIIAIHSLFLITNIYRPIFYCVTGSSLFKISRMPRLTDKYPCAIVANFAAKSSALTVPKRRCTSSDSKSILFNILQIIFTSEFERVWFCALTLLINVGLRTAVSNSLIFTGILSSVSDRHLWGAVNAQTIHFELTSEIIWRILRVCSLLSDEGTTSLGHRQRRRFGSEIGYDGTGVIYLVAWHVERLDSDDPVTTIKNWTVNRWWSGTKNGCNLYKGSRQCSCRCNWSSNAIIS